MEKDIDLAYAEVYEILNLLEDEYVEKIPEKVRNFFKEERFEEYKPEIKVDVPLTKQNLKRETMVLLAILNFNYWCETEEEKQEFLNELAQNEKEKKELEEKYNPDNLSKNRKYDNVSSNDIEDKVNVSMVEYKKHSLLRRILNKITGFFKKK